MWRNEEDVTGFRLSYEVPSVFTGWYPLTYMFGFQDGSIYEEVDLGIDLQELQICVNQGGDSSEQNFRGFKFLEYGSDNHITLSASCSNENWQTFDLES